jgi:hypothetical protein
MTYSDIIEQHLPYNDIEEAGASVKDLRRAGRHVQCWHRRRYYDPVNKRYVFLTAYERKISTLPEYVKMCETGGETLVIIDDKWVGFAECSKKDNYCKKAGVALALSRLIYTSNYEQRKYK